MKIVRFSAGVGISLASLVLLTGLVQPNWLAKLNWLVQPVQADRLQSDSYVIQFGNFNTGSGEFNDGDTRLTYTMGQTGAGPFGTYGSTEFFIGSGFQYIYQIQEFGFSIDRAQVDLGELMIGQHSTATNTLTITTRGAGGYSIYAYELHPLQHSNGLDFIPDTTCDGGGCDETTAQVWTDQSVAGFGFNVLSDDAAADFLNTTYFRQFADRSASEEMQAIMTSANIVTNRTGSITYKAGINSNIAAGNYQTGIVYVAVPGY